MESVFKNFASLVKFNLPVFSIAPRSPMKKEEHFVTMERNYRKLKILYLNVEEKALLCIHL